MAGGRWRIREEALGCRGLTWDRGPRRSESGRAIEVLVTVFWLSPYKRVRVTMRSLVESGKTYYEVHDDATKAWDVRKL